PALVPQSLPIYQGNMWQQQVTITESQTLVFPVAFDSGWSVQINQGHKQVVKSIQGGLIGVTLPPGTHDLVFTYETPGLRFGTSVTVVSSCSLIGIIIWRKQVQKRQRGGYQW
ncbi:MAG: YfhO family protein, partial [Culicoidibacterales bacterium]